MPERESDTSDFAQAVEAHDDGRHGGVRRHHQQRRWRRGDVGGAQRLDDVRQVVVVGCELL